MNITNLKREESARIVSLGKIDESFTKRLMDLGIYESANVVMLNRLSFNRLYIIEVDDIEICLRKEDAEMIEVQK